jgi:hypothetical protein
MTQRSDSSEICTTSLSPFERSPLTVTAFHNHFHRSRRLTSRVYLRSIPVWSVIISKVVAAISHYQIGFCRVLYHLLLCLVVICSSCRFVNALLSTFLPVSLLMSPHAALSSLFILTPLYPSPRLRPLTLLSPPRALFIYYGKQHQQTYLGIFNIDPAVLDTVLKGLGFVPGFRKYFDKRVLGDPQGDYVQIYHKSTNDMANHFFPAHGYPYLGDDSVPPNAIDALIFGFEDFCLYDPDDKAASDMAVYIANALALKGIAEEDVVKMTNSLTENILQIYAFQNTSWQYYDRTYVVTTQSGKTAEFDFTMLCTTFSRPGMARIM